MRVVLNTSHLSPVGGGENYLMRFAHAIREAGHQVYVVNNWPELFEQYNGFYHKFDQYYGLFKPDLWLFCSHFLQYPPVGEKNYQIVFFPNPERVPPKGYQGAVAVSKYSAKYTRDYWKLPCKSIDPCVDEARYTVGKKEKKIVALGHFFEEPDGHSKNQHILCDAFTGLEGYRLILFGNADENNRPYLDKLRKAAKGKNIKIEVNKSATTIRRELSTASHLWHANGYGRSDPAQTEHFGIVILEALASGVVPIVHKSGGAPEIAGVLTWEQPEQLAELTRGHEGIPRLDKRYTVEAFNERVAKWVSGL